MRGFVFGFFCLWFCCLFWVFGRVCMGCLGSGCLLCFALVFVCLFVLCFFFCGCLCLSLLVGLFFCVVGVFVGVLWGFVCVLFCSFFGLGRGWLFVLIVLIDYWFRFCTGFVLWFFLVYCVFLVVISLLGVDVCFCFGVGWG